MTVTSGAGVALTLLFPILGRISAQPQTGVECRAVGAQSGRGRGHGSIHRVLLQVLQPENTRWGHGALLPWPRLV